MRIEFGISAALVTPFDTNGNVDHSALIDHAKHTVGLGADGVTLFGTTGEGASLSQSERTAVLEAMVSANFDMGCVTATVYANSVQDAFEQAAIAFDYGVRKILLPPPFYFKDISTDALSLWFSQVMAGLPKGMQVILYHIPQITMVPLPPQMVHDLQQKFPDQVVAVKDSSGNWENSAELLTNPELAVLIGDERQLPKAAALGGAGAISGMANLFPDRLKTIMATSEPDVDLFDLVNVLVTLPVTPAVKAIVGQMYNDDSWQRVRSPLVSTPQSALPPLFDLLTSLLSETVE